MSITSVELLSATELSFAGTLFPISDTCEGILMGKISDSCTVQSAETVVATFDMGVPTSSGEMVP